jgi:hypothetical protein
MSFRCATCDEEHEGLPQIGFEFPDPYFDVPENERGERVEVSSDMCRVDDDYFIRGVIEIHVHDHDEPFGFGVWVSQKKENFETYADNFDSDKIGPFFGWLSTTLTCYEEDSFGLKTMAHFRGKGIRPYIEVEPTNHPLALDQQNGITLNRAWKLVHHFMP